MRDVSKADLEALFNEFDTLRRQYERMVADLNRRIVSMGRQGNTTGSLKLAGEVAIYRERLGYCMAVLAMVRWMLGGRAPNMNPTRR